MSARKVVRKAVEIAIRNPEVYTLMKSRHDGRLCEILSKPVKYDGYILRLTYGALKEVDRKRAWALCLYTDASNQKKSASQVINLLDELLGLF